MKSKLGSGNRFASLSKSLSKQPGIYDPKGLAAAIGRKKYGDKKMASMAAKGKKMAKGGEVTYDQGEELPFDPTNEDFDPMHNPGDQEEVMRQSAYDDFYPERLAKGGVAHDDSDDECMCEGCMASSGGLMHSRAKMSLGGEVDDINSDSNEYLDNLKENYKIHSQFEDDDGEDSRLVSRHSEEWPEDDDEHDDEMGGYHDGGRVAHEEDMDDMLSQDDEQDSFPRVDYDNEEQDGYNRLDSEYNNKEAMKGRLKRVMGAMRLKNMRYR